MWLSCFGAAFWDMSWKRARSNRFNMADLWLEWQKNWRRAKLHKLDYIWKLDNIPKNKTDSMVSLDFHFEIVGMVWKYVNVHGRCYVKSKNFSLIHSLLARQVCTSNTVIQQHRLTEEFHCFFWSYQLKCNLVELSFTPSLDKKKWS